MQNKHEHAIYVPVNTMTDFEIIKEILGVDKFVTCAMDLRETGRL